MKIEKQLQASQRAELFAGEKIRRLSELLDSARETEIIARKENNILTSNIATLQTGIQTLTDDDIKKEMTVLYHELEQWVVKYCETHFPHQPEDGSARCKSQQVAAIQSEISILILRNFWTATFVGCGVQGDQYVAQMTEVIMDQCKFRMECRRLVFMSTTEGPDRPKSRCTALAVCYEHRCDRFGEIKFAVPVP